MIFLYASAKTQKKIVRKTQILYHPTIGIYTWLKKAVDFINK